MEVEIGSCSDYVLIDATYFYIQIISFCTFQNMIHDDYLQDTFILHRKSKHKDSMCTYLVDISTSQIFAFSTSFHGVPEVGKNKVILVIITPINTLCIQTCLVKFWMVNSY